MSFLLFDIVVILNFLNLLVQFVLGFQERSTMARYISAAIDKFRSEMVEFYLQSYFNHTGADAIILVRKNSAPGIRRVASMEMRGDGIFLRFGEPVLAQAENVDHESADSPTLAPSDSRDGMFDEFDFRESLPSHRSESDTNLSGLYSCDTMSNATSLMLGASAGNICYGGETRGVPLQNRSPEVSGSAEGIPMGLLQICPHVPARD